MAGTIGSMREFCALKGPGGTLLRDIETNGKTYKDLKHHFQTSAEGRNATVNVASSILGRISNPRTKYTNPDQKLEDKRTCLMIRYRRVNRWTELSKDEEEFRRAFNSATGQYENHLSLAKVPFDPADSSDEEGEDTSAAETEEEIKTKSKPNTKTKVKAQTKAKVKTNTKLKAKTKGKGKAKAKAKDNEEIDDQVQDSDQAQNQPQAEDKATTQAKVQTAANIDPHKGTQLQYQTQDAQLPKINAEFSKPPPIKLQAFPPTANAGATAVSDTVQFQDDLLQTSLASGLQHSAANLQSSADAASTIHSAFGEDPTVIALPGMLDSKDSTPYAREIIRKKFYPGLQIWFNKQLRIDSPDVADFAQFKHYSYKTFAEEWDALPDAVILRFWAKAGLSLPQ